MSDLALVSAAAHTSDLGLVSAAALLPDTFIQGVSESMLFC